MTAIELVKWQERPPRTRGALPKVQGTSHSTQRSPTGPRIIPRLPNELIHLIIESVDAADLVCLTELCLVSKDFLRPSRKALYTSISIYQHYSGGDESNDSSALLCDILALHPHLATLVRRIEILEWECPEDSKIRLSSHLRALLPVCHGVDSLNSEIYFDTHVWGWEPSVATEILEVLGSLAPRLKHLELNINAEEDISRDVSALLRRATGLTSLTYRGPPNFIGEPPTFELNQLEISERDAGTIFEVLTQSPQSSLINLHVVQEYTHPIRESPHLDLTRLPNLHTLKLFAHHEQDTLQSLHSQISDLPLLHLDLHVRFVRFNPGRPASPSAPPGSTPTRHFPIRPDLPPTLTHIRLDVLSIDEITDFLDSGSCPHLCSANFELQHKPDPWSLIEVARAAKERGLRVVEKEPKWDGNYDLDQSSVRDRRRGGGRRPRQTLLSKFWDLTVVDMQSKNTIELVKWQEKPARTRGALPKIRPSSYPNRVAPLFLPKPTRCMPHLPNEIIYLIIENVRDDDEDDDDGSESSNASLARLCLVSKGFLAPSRKALYAGIYIYSHPESSGDSCKPLCDSLTLHPHLAALVRRIEMEEEVSIPVPLLLRLRCTSTYSYLKALAPICTAVDSLSVYLWATEDLAGAMNILTTLGSFAPGLKHLNLYISLRHPHPLNKGVSTLFRLAKGLKFLEYRGPRVDEPPRFELNELRLSQTNNEDQLDELAQSSRSSLRILDFNSGPGPGNADLGQFPNLQVLRLLGSRERGEFETLTSSLSSPLSRLDIRFHSNEGGRLTRSHHHIPPILPPTLTHIRLDVPSISEITDFLDSESCPHLSSAKFELQVKPTPWTRLTAARAATERGLRLVEEDPRWDGDYFLDEVVEGNRIPKGQRVLQDYWK